MSFELASMRQFKMHVTADGRRPKKFLEPRRPLRSADRRFAAADLRSFLRNGPFNKSSAAR